jgi:hypothetical protein
MSFVDFPACKQMLICLLSSKIFFMLLMWCLWFQLSKTKPFALHASRLHLQNYKFLLPWNLTVCCCECLRLNLLHGNLDAAWFHIRSDTCYGLEGPGVESREGEIFRTRPDLSWTDIFSPYNGYRVYFPGVKRSERGVEHPRLPSAPAEGLIDLWNLFSLVAGITLT